MTRKLTNRLSSLVSRRSLLVLCLLSVVLCLFSSGCQSLRFAPGQSQKKIAFQAHVTARDIEAQGTGAHSPAAVQQVQATQASLAYIGLPADPVIVDYDTTIDQANLEAARRPDVNDVFAAAEGGLSLAEQLAALFGFGGLTLGGRSLVKWIGLLRTKAKGMEEIVGGNELLVKWLEANRKNEELEAFKAFQRLSQKGKTPELVATTRIATKSPGTIIPPNVELPLVTLEQFSTPSNPEPTET